MRPFEVSAKALNINISAKPQQQLNKEVKEGRVTIPHQEEENDMWTNEQEQEYEVDNRQTITESQRSTKVNK